jgi:hypothetical protein
MMFYDTFHDTYHGTSSADYCNYTGRKQLIAYGYGGNDTIWGRRC